MCLYSYEHIVYILIEQQSVYIFMEQHSVYITIEH